MKQQQTRVMTVNEDPTMLWSNEPFSDFLKLDTSNQAIPLYSFLFQALSVYRALDIPSELSFPEIITIEKFKEWYYIIDPAMFSFRTIGNGFFRIMDRKARKRTILSVSWAGNVKDTGLYIDIETVTGAIALLMVEQQCTAPTSKEADLISWSLKGTDVQDFWENFNHGSVQDVPNEGIFLGDNNVMHPDGREVIWEGETLVNGSRISQDDAFYLTMPTCLYELTDSAEDKSWKINLKLPAPELQSDIVFGMGRVFYDRSEAYWKHYNLKLGKFYNLEDFREDDQEEIIKMAQFDKPSQKLSIILGRSKEDNKLEAFKISPVCNCNKVKKIKEGGKK